MTEKNYIIAIDFDGTIVDHRFPDIGDDVPDAARVITRLMESGHQLILYTMRSDGREDGGNYLKDAIAHCEKLGLRFWGHNHNHDQSSWTSSPKVYAHIYIDDAALGCPLRDNPRAGGRPFVDWIAVENMLIARGVLA